MEVARSTRAPRLHHAARPKATRSPATLPEQLVKGRQDAQVTTWEPGLAVGDVAAATAAPGRH
jgi:hypothetical protein